MKSSSFGTAGLPDAIISYQALRVHLLLRMKPDGRKVTKMYLWRTFILISACYRKDIER